MGEKNNDDLIGPATSATDPPVKPSTTSQINNLLQSKENLFQILGHHWLYNHWLYSPLYYMNHHHLISL